MVLTRPAQRLVYTGPGGLGNPPVGLAGGGRVELWSGDAPRRLRGDGWLALANQSQGSRTRMFLAIALAVVSGLVLIAGVVTMVPVVGAIWAVAAVITVGRIARGFIRS